MENLKQELDQLGAPNLSKLKAQLEKPQLPDGYFDTLHDRVFDRLRAEGIRATEPPPARLSMSYGDRWRKWAAAAVFVGLTATTWWYLQMPAPQPAVMATTDISTEDAEAYLLATLDVLETEELAVQEVDLPNPLQEQVIRKTESKATQTHITPTKTELDLLEDLTDEDLEDLL